MYDIGIIGGMGPKATSVLFDKIVDYTDATCDQDHPSIVILDNSKIPDRTKYIMGITENFPITGINEALDFFRLILKQGATVGMVCNTAHYFADELSAKSKELGFSFVNMPEKTMEYIALSNMHKKCCILCTLGTRYAGIYDKANSTKLDICYPDESQCEQIQRIIYQIKDSSNVNYEETALCFSKLLDSIGDYTFVLACTELSVLDKSLLGDKTIVDAMDILSMLLVNKCGHKMRVVDNRYDVEILRKM